MHKCTQQAETSRDIDTSVPALHIWDLTPVRQGSRHTDCRRTDRRTELLVSECLFVPITSPHFIDIHQMAPRTICC